MTDKCPCKMTYDITDQLAAAALDLDSRHPQEIIELLEKAKTTIDMLRGYRDEAEAQAAIASMIVDKLRLTDEEREAVAYFANFQWTMLKPYAATLRNLLNRHGGAND